MVVFSASGEKFLSWWYVSANCTVNIERSFALHIDWGEGGVRDNHEVHLVRESRLGPDRRSHYVQVLVRRREVLKRLESAGFAFFYGRRKPQRMDRYRLRSDRRGGVHTQPGRHHAGDSADAV